MDFDAMISAHTQWKTRFRKLVDNPGERLDAGTVEKDDQCELGKWLYQEGSRHKQMREYSELQAAHARFHLAAAEVIRTMNMGASAKAKEMLDPLTGGFGRAASDCVNAIVALRNQVQSPQTHGR